MSSANAGVVLKTATNSRTGTSTDTAYGVQYHLVRQIIRPAAFYVARQVFTVIGLYQKCCICCDVYSTFDA